MKNKILIASLVIFSAVGFSQKAFACGMSCVAECRLTCSGTPQSETGCSDADYSRSLQACCTQAFKNTPGIDQVACGGAS